MDRETQILPLISRLYEASVDAARWPVFLTELSELLHGVLPVLFLHDTERHAGTLAVNVGYDSKMVSEYEKYFAQRNIWLRSGAPLLTAGRVRTSHMMCSRRTLLRSEWYADYCRRLGISQGIGATIERNVSFTSNIAIFAGDDRVPFAADDISRVQLLMPHLQRALRIHHQLAESDLRRNELTTALENLSAGVLLVTADAKVLFMNRAARQICEARDAVYVDTTGLRACRSTDTATLRAFVGTAAQTSAGEGIRPGGMINIARPSGHPALEVMVSPVSTGATWCFTQRAAAAVYLTDPLRIAARPEAVLARLHGFTPAEARVGALIARGRSGKQAAEELGLSYNTLKTHLKRLFAKTGTRGQRELIRVLLAGAGQVNPPGGGL
jgi:DNA-binding CsgD family transcriptional regulator/PAS domain-containing protein